MTLVYKGIKKDEKGSRGCGCRKRHGSRMSTIKVFRLPSGNKIVFRMGQRTSVSKSDGDWLLREYPGVFEA